MRPPGGGDPIVRVWSPLPRSRLATTAPTTAAAAAPAAIWPAPTFERCASRETAAGTPVPDAGAVADAEPVVADVPAEAAVAPAPAADADLAVSSRYPATNGMPRTSGAMTPRSPELTSSSSSASARHCGQSER